MFRNVVVASVSEDTQCPPGDDIEDRRPQHPWVFGGQAED